MITHLFRATRCGLLLALIAFGSTAAAVDLRPGGAVPAATISGTITFLYYDDLTAAVRFYGETLGLPLTMDEDWVKIYALTGASSVGLVKKGHGFHQPAADKPVMLSLVTDNVDAWHERLLEAGTPILKPPPPKDAGPSEDRAPIRGFIVADPGGYTVEIFSWHTADAD